MQPDKPSPANRIRPDSFAAVIRAFQSSPFYRTLAPGTQSNYARAFRIAETHEGLGGINVAEMRPALVQAFLDAMAEDAPGAAKGARVALSSLESWALVRDMLPRAIMTGTSVAHREQGHQPWTLEQVALAESHADADLARAVTLAVNTGQRGSDLIRMRRGHIQRNGGRLGITVTQQKTGRTLWVPFTATFATVVDGWPRAAPDYLLLNRGEPYTRQLLSCHWTRERDTNQALAPLSGLTLHGLRATAVTRARRDGLTDLQISNLYGMSEQMVARYSKLADQTDMALAAVATLDRVASQREQIKVLQFRRR